MRDFHVLGNPHRTFALFQTRQTYLQCIRTSWLNALEYQRTNVVSRRDDVEEYEKRRQPLQWCRSTSKSSSFTTDSEQEERRSSSLLCASTLAVNDPFRNLFYTTNPTMYRRKDWIKYFASTVAILGDARAIEESITVSYMCMQEKNGVKSVTLCCRGCRTPILVMLDTCVRGSFRK